MALKHLRDYYDKVCKDREDLIQEIKEFEEECNKGLMEPERLEAFKATLAPIMKNYEQISYIMYLLNMPKKKEKCKVYEKTVGKKIKSQVSKENTTDALLQENKEALSKLKQFNTRI